MEDPEVRVNRIAELFRLIFNNWVTTKRFTYTIRPSEDIRGKSIDEMKKLTFWVGVDRQGATLSCVDLVALFSMIKDQTEQMKGRGGNQPRSEREMHLESIINLAPSDEQIGATLSQLQFTIDQGAKPASDASVMLKFKGIISLPGGATNFQPKELALPEAESQSLFGMFSKAIKGGTSFLIGLKMAGDDREIVIRFTPVGKTAAYFMLSHDVNKEPQHIHGLVALLTKLDPAEDRSAIEEVRKYAAVQTVPSNAFDAALAEDQPVSATFFADVGSANYPPLLTVIRIVSAAFFGQFTAGPQAN